MKITSDNYEIWFLDYLEGRLDQEGREEVRTFLLHHPDLAGGLEAISTPLSADTSVRFHGKELLKKSRYDDLICFEETAIGSMEGDLSESQSSDFNSWLSRNPEKQQDILTFKRTRLQPDAGIGFPGKKKLIKKPQATISLVRIAAAAALLLLALLLFLPSGKRPLPEQLSEVENFPAGQPATEIAGTKSRIAGLIMENKKTIPRSTPELLYTQKVAKKEKSVPPELISRREESFETLEPRSVSVRSEFPAYYDLVPVRIEPVLYASNEIPLSEYLNIKLKALKEDGPKGFFTREEIAVTGLRLFSLLPGKHLTGKKGRDGKLRSITFNTQMLAISIPVNN